ncbi:MAG: 1-deoxy-D-xylulose-5-phosphate reductoisomerase, partial [Spirochaetales bacterium]|nr:1-deoxy-D-xylulose-5-phosphate reductoisomerase [Spirochaetales bacterium]
MKKVFILGVTGSIGISALKVIDEYSDKLQIVGISAHKNAKKLSDLAKKYKCETVVLTGESKSDFNNISHYGLDSLCNQIEKSNADIV